MKQRLQELLPNPFAIGCQTGRRKRIQKHRTPDHFTRTVSLYLHNHVPIGTLCQDGSILAHRSQPALDESPS